MTEKINMQIKNDKGLCEETQELREQFEESRKMDTVSDKIARFSERKEKANGKQ